MTSAMRTSAWNDLLLEPVVRAANEDRLVEVDLRLHPRRQIAQALDDLLDRVDDLDRVAAGDAQHVQEHGVLAVDGDRLRLGRAAVLDARDVADEDGLVADELDRRLADGLDALRDGVRVDVRVEVRREELARRAGARSSWPRPRRLSVAVTRRACALSGSTTTLICRSRPPSGAALATPEMPSSSGSMLLNA